MWSVSAIIEINAEATKVAREYGNQPWYPVSRDDIRRQVSAGLPYVGYDPEGFELVDTEVYYPWERWGDTALAEKLEEWFDTGVREDCPYAFAIHEGYQFHASVGVYRKDGVQ